MIPRGGNDVRAVRTVASMVAGKGGDYTKGGYVSQPCDLVVGRGDD
jgi:hypothetical protein